MSLANWFAQCRREYQDDPARKKLLALFDDAFEERESDPNEALVKYKEGKELADRLGEAWWSLLFDKMQIDARVHYLRDYRDLLESAAANVREVRRPVFARFPARAAIHDTLLAAYIGIDAEGHYEAIQEGLDLLEKEVPPEPGPDRYLLLARRMEFEYELGHLDQAQAEGNRARDFARGDNNTLQANHFLAFTYARLCQLAYQRRQWGVIDDYVRDGLEVVREAGHRREWAEVLAWQAVYERYRDQKEAAARSLRESLAKMEEVHLPSLGWFAARAAYHDLNEQPAEVLHQLDEALATVVDRSQFLRECRLRIDRLRVMVKLERSLEDDLEQARAAARKLRFPEKPLREIEVIEQGE